MRVVRQWGVGWRLGYKNLAVWNCGGILPKVLMGGLYNVSGLKCYLQSGLFGTSVAVQGREEL